MHDVSVCRCPPGTRYSSRVVLYRELGLRCRPEKGSELAAAQLGVVLVREDDTDARGAYCAHLVCGGLHTTCSGATVGLRGATVCAATVCGCNGAACMRTVAKDVHRVLGVRLHVLCRPV